MQSTDNYLETLAENTRLDQSEGQLSVDVHETADEIIIRSAIAGVGVEDLDISVTSDMITIRGERQEDCREWSDGTTHIEECYWGKFSRTIMLPAPVIPDEAKAILKNGILTIKLKKTEMYKQISVRELD